MIKIIGSVSTTRGQCNYQEDRGILHVSGEEGPMVLGVFDGHSTSFASDYCRRHMRTVVYQLISRSPAIVLDPTTTPTIKPITKTLDSAKFTETNTKGTVIIGNSDSESDSDDDDDLFDEDEDDLIFAENGDSCNFSDENGDNCTFSDENGERDNCTTMGGVLCNAFKIVNNAFLEELEDGGCTACFCVLVNGTLWVANAGDSRCVVGGRDGRVHFETVDHKPDAPGERARIEAADHSVEMVADLVDGKRVAVARVDGILACSRSIGDADLKDFGVPQEKQAVTCVPDVCGHRVAVNDEFVVVASDGVWDVMSSQQVVEFVNKRIKKEKVVDQKVVDSIANELVVYATGKLKSYDNTTVVLGFFV